MFEILHPILDWLSTKQGSGPRSSYGWQIVLMIAVGIAGMLKASEIRSKKISLKQRVRKQLSERPLVATAFRGEAGQAIQNHAKIEKTDVGYVVVVGRSPAEDKQSLEFCSVEEVEEFLETKTIFRLADFKPCSR